MKHKNFLIVANEESAIIVNVEEFGSLVIIPNPALDYKGQERESVPTGSCGGKKTFKPGTAESLLFGITTPGPVQKHSLDKELKKASEAIIFKGCQAIQAELAKLLEDNLIPKNKEEVDDSGEG